MKKILQTSAMASVALLLYLTGFFVFFAPLPFMVSYHRYGALQTLISFLVALVALSSLYFLPSLSTVLPLTTGTPASLSTLVMVGSIIFFFYYGWTGLTIAFVSKRQISLEWGILGIVGVSLLVPGLLLAVFSVVGHLHPLQELRAAFNSFLNHVIDMQKDSRISDDDRAFLKQYASAIVEQMMLLLPSLLICMTAVIASMNIVALRYWVAVEKTFPRWGDFSIWRLKESWIWLPIITGAAYFANLYLIQSAFLGTILVNLLIVLAGIYLFQGWAILSYFFRRKLPPLLRLSITLLIFLFFQIFGLFIIALGLFDFWFDFRKPKKLT